jgi:AraC-like DNA-binding protein
MQPARIQTSRELEALAPQEVHESLTASGMLRDPLAYMALHPEIGAFEQIGAERHYRYDCADGQLTGHGELVAVADGFLMQVSDAETRWPRVISARCPDVMRVRIAVDGGEWSSREGERPMLTEGPTTLVVIEPPDQPPAQVVFTGRQSMILLFIDRDALQALWKGREQELPALLQSFLAGTLKQTASRRLALKSDLLRCLEDLRRCDQEGLARTLFLRSKGFEIFCHVLKMLELDEGFGGADASLVTSRGVLRAQQILRQRFVSPPSLDDLAREVGVSRSSLCAGFRQIVGQSIGSYVQELRMEQALELLSDSSQPITEVAYSVGYCHQSSFTVAVQRRYGMSPSELRRSARPLER